MNKLATIERIYNIQPHFNADKLSVAKIKGWSVVIKKDEYKENDLVVFIQIDSVVPCDNPYFSFLEKQKYRVWNAKFRGAPSQGLVCPLSLLPPNTEVFEGMDVTEILGVKKYEKGVDAQLNGDAIGKFPTNLISMTDEDNLLNVTECLEEFMGEECYLTVKADGSSVTVIYYDGEVRVCSRRLELKEGTGFWSIVNSYNLPEKLKTMGKNIAIQAEACGGKIQGNPLGLSCPTMFVFNVKDLDSGNWYGYNEIYDICQKLEIPMVNLAHDIFKFDSSWNIERLQKIADSVIYTASNGQKKPGEGIVLRPTTPKYSRILQKMLSVKILNINY